MARTKEQLRLKYRSLRDMGFSSKEANKMKYRSFNTLEKNIQESNIRAKKRSIKELDNVINNYEYIKHYRLIKEKDKYGNTKYRTPFEVTGQYLRYNAKYNYIVGYITTDDPRNEEYFTVATYKRLKRSEVLEKFYENYYEGLLMDRYQAEVLFAHVIYAFSL